MNNMIMAVQKVLSNYARFNGRATRSEFWWWTLSLFLILFACTLLDAWLIMPLLGFDGSADNSGQPLTFLVNLGLLIPNLAVSIRRLHDVGSTGWWVLIAVVPLVGIAVLLYFYIQMSEEFDNRFGAREFWPPSP